MSTQKGLTEAENLFIAARGLNPGQSIAKDFSTKSQADSFRVGLYKVRNNFEDYTINISIDGNTVFLRKVSTVANYRLIDVDGTVINEEVVLKTSYDRDLEELLEEAAKFSWNAEVTEEAITSLKERYGVKGE